LNSYDQNDHSSQKTGNRSWNTFRKEVKKNDYPQLKSTQEHSSGFRIGQTVQHPKFGEGTILALDGQGTQTRVHINFHRAGSKWLVLGYAKLEPV
jgi:hypothetical protein